MGANYTRIEGLQISADGSYQKSIFGGGTNLLINSCIIKSSSNQEAIINNNYDGIILNSLLRYPHTGNSAIAIRGQTSLYGCTAIGGGASTVFIESPYVTSVVKNCAVFNWSTLGGSLHSSSNYNATDLGSITGANSVASLTYADQFENTSSDWRAKSTGDLQAGTPDATNTPDDITGLTRDATTPWIGCWEVEGGGHDPLAANVGAYTLTGQAVLLKKGFKLTSEVGAYTYTGQTVLLKRGFLLTAGVGTYSLTGIDAGLRGARTLALAVGQYVLSGQAALLKKGFYLDSDVGTYVLTGIDVSFVYSGAASPLSANVGQYTYTGQTVLLKYGRRFSVEVGAFTLTGNSVNLLFGHEVGAETGSYTLTGNTTNLLKGFYSLSSPGSYTLTGNVVLFSYNRRISLGVGTYTLTGNAVSLLIPSEEHHTLQGTLRWSPLRNQTILIGNDNTVWLTGVRDSLTPKNANGTPLFIDDCTVTWEIKTEEYPNGLLVGQGTAVAADEGGEYSIQLDDAITDSLDSDEEYWLNVTFVQPVTGYTGLISSRFLARVRSGRTVGT